MCENFAESPENSELCTINIPVRLLSQFGKIMMKDGCGFIALKDKEGPLLENENITIIYMSNKKEIVESAMVEAGVLTGFIREMPRNSLKYITSRYPEYSVYNIKNVRSDILLKIENINKDLKSEYRFIVFKETAKNGNEISFLKKTKKMVINSGSTVREAEYSIPKIVSAAIACALLDSGRAAEYKKYEKKIKEYNEHVSDQYYETSEPFYVVPSVINKDGSLKLHSDNAKWIDPEDEEMLKEKYDEYIKQMNGFNVIPFTATKNELVEYNEKDGIVQNFKDAPYIPDTLIREYLKRKIIHTINEEPDIFSYKEDEFDNMNISDMKGYVKHFVTDIFMVNTGSYMSTMYEDHKVDSCISVVLRALEQYHLEPETIRRELTYDERENINLSREREETSIDEEIEIDDR